MIGFDELYSWVKDLPVVDWHNHLDPGIVSDDGPLGSLYEVWVKTDPYKHRAMRICGESERVITGDAGEEEKWSAWTRTLPKLVGNALFVWAEMELGFLNDALGLEEERLGTGALRNIPLAALTPKKLLERFRVEYCDPGYRMNAGDALDLAGMDAVAARGGRVLDVSVDDVSALDPASFLEIGREASRRGWTMLLHMGALRQTSGRLRAAAGPAGGYAGMRSPVDPCKVAEILDALERAGALPRTVLLSLNPEAHAQLAVLAGSFNGEGMPGKVQLGPAWWWCDHEEGIRDVLEKNAAYGVLSTFVGMTTDSRSLLSFVRHDYFRRILCRWTAEKIASGAFPDDAALLRPMLENVCYRNSKGIVS
jgi:glucuronate isomerase